MLSMRHLVILCLVAAAVPARAADCHSNLMIVLDRSCSMNQKPKASVMQSKWEIAVAAITKLTTKYAGKLDFGLIMFPDQTTDSCLQDGPIYLNVAPGQEGQFPAKLTAAAPGAPCTTPIKPGIDQVSTDPVFAMPYVAGNRRSFVLFISDGRQTCGGNVAAIETSVKALFTNGYPTYVVGFGGGVDPMGLNTFAQAGGVPRQLIGDAGTNLYYQADDAMSLDQALDAIAGEVVGAGEFITGCSGTPCPDGRCFGAGETCIDGACVGPDMSAGAGGGDGDMGGGGGGGGGGGNGGGADGCACAVGRGASLPLYGLLGVLAVGAMLARRRLRRRR